MSTNAIRPLTGKVALVTGATRGIGKGIALQLAEAGALVYITGRTLKLYSLAGKPGSLEDTAEEIRSRGGQCVPVQVDHEVDAQIAALFQKICDEQNGRLDILVNNAYKGVSTIFENMKLKFWEMSPEVWDDINNVGLRNHYFCSVYAARLMVPVKQGLIVNITSFGGMSYLFNVPYGVGKAALDRMAVDCGIELKSSNVTCLSLCPGAVRTEVVQGYKQKATAEPEAGNSPEIIEIMTKLWDEGESIEFAGKIIVQMAQDKNIMSYTSKVVIAAEYANAHGIHDIDGRVLPNFRSVKQMAQSFLPKNLQFVSYFVPSFIKVPKFAIDIANSKY